MRLQNGCFICRYYSVNEGKFKYIIEYILVKCDLSFLQKAIYQILILQENAPKQHPLLFVDAVFLYPLSGNDHVCAGQLFMQVLFFAFTGNLNRHA